MLIGYRNSSLLDVHWDTIWEEETFGDCFFFFFLYGEKCPKQDKS